MWYNMIWARSAAIKYTMSVISHPLISPSPSVSTYSSSSPSFIPLFFILLLFESTQIWFDLIYTDLIYTDLIYSDLLWPDLIWSTLTWSDLIYSDLTSPDLTRETNIPHFIYCGILSPMLPHMLHHLPPLHYQTHHATSDHITSHQTTSHHITSEFTKMNDK